MTYASAPDLPTWRRHLQKLDPFVFWVGALLLALFVFSPQQGMATLGFALANLVGTAPFLLLSIAMAAYAGASGADNLIARAFQGHTATMIVAASLVGALSPFCSCGVIPIIAALLSMGVPLAPVMAFWLASPIMDPSMFVMTSGILGIGFAGAKTLAAIGIGLLGGFGMHALRNSAVFADPLREGVGNGGCGGSSVRAPKPVVWAFWREPERLARFRTSGLKTTWFLGKWLFLAYVLESLMLAYVPAEMVSSLLGGGGLAPIAVATLVGVPAYLNGFAALPLVDGLVDQGMMPGAALAFMVAGGVTSIPAAIAVWALVRKPVFFAYLAFALSGSFAAGLLFQIGLTLF